MSSKYLGAIGQVEAHAFSENGDYRDEGLSRALHEMRYGVLAMARKPIFCTAVNPDHRKKQEINPHDLLSSTLHFAVVCKKTGDIEYVLSAARYGKEFGVPLENRYSPNGYPEGASLDRFVRDFLRKNYESDKDVEEGRIVEIYRHVRSPKPRLRGLKSLGARLALYCAAYQELVRNALERDKLPSDLWVWDAIPAYADKYAYVGGVFRDFTVSSAKWLPTWKSNKMEERIMDGVRHCYLGREQITRSLPVLHPPENGDFGHENPGEIRPVGMIDGLVDVRRVEFLISKHPYFFPIWGFRGLQYRVGQRLALGVSCKRMYSDHHYSNVLSRIIGFITDYVLGTRRWALEKEDEETSHSLLEDGLRPLYEL